MIVRSTTSCSSDEPSARPTSLSAVSSPTLRVSSTVRFFSSLTSSARSMAITAWSAKDCSKATCRSVNAPACCPVTVIAPTGCPARSIGTASTER
jgi:hypothetical protein